MAESLFGHPEVMYIFERYWPRVADEGDDPFLLRLLTTITQCSGEERAG